MLDITPVYFYSKVTKDKGLHMVREALRKTDAPEEVRTPFLEVFSIWINLDNSTSSQLNC